MKTIMCHHHANYSFTIGLLVLAASLVWAPPVRGDELIQNGSFAAGMTGWKVAPKLDGWNPCASGAPSLTPPINDYAGILLYQDLNVTNTSLGTVTLTVGLEKIYGSSGRSVAVYLDYATTNLQVKRLMVLNPDNASFPDSTYTNLSVDISLPAEAAKVVRLLIGSLDSNNSFNLNLVGLSAPGLSSGPLPILTVTGTPPSEAVTAPASRSSPSARQAHCTVRSPSRKSARRSPPESARSNCHPDSRWPPAPCRSASP